MKVKVLTLALALVAVVTMSFMSVTNNPEKVEPVAVELQKITYGELKALYGNDIIQLENGATLEDNAVLMTNANPCGQGIINIPCTGQFAYIQSQAQREANACCCLIAYAALCCDPVLGVTAIFTEAEPTNPNCN